MSIERYMQLDRGHSQMAAQEIHEGWHFCQYLDGALTWPESFCNCATDTNSQTAKACTNDHEDTLRRLWSESMAGENH